MKIIRDTTVNHGLDWYDYGARYYDAVILQFTTIDPLAEKDYSISSYACCAGNPVMFVDPDGRSYTKYEDEEGNELLNTVVGGLSAGITGLGIRPKGSAGLKPLGLGTTGRSVPKNLAEQLSLKEIMSNPSEEKVIMNNIKDSRWSGWSKMQYIHYDISGHKTTIHYVGKHR